MKWIEWVMAISLVVVGLSCLTMSASWLFTPESIKTYANKFLFICLLAGIPAIIGGLFYLTFRKK